MKEPFTLHGAAEEQRFTSALETCLRGRELTAELGKRALARMPLPELLGYVLGELVAILDLPRGDAFEVHPGELRLLVSEGEGAVTPPLELPTGTDTAASRTLHALGVVASDNRAETHFQPLATGFATSVNLAVRSPSGAQAVLALHRNGEFAPDEVALLATVGQLLGEAVAREETERALLEHNERLSLLSEMASQLLLASEPHKFINQSENVGLGLS